MLISRKVLCAAIIMCAATSRTEMNLDVPADFYVAVNGRDEWSGKLPEPDGNGTDGPFASLSRARDAIRERKKTESGNLKVLIRGGSYILKKCVVFSLQDSAHDGQLIEYSAYPGENPVFSSGLTISGWRKMQPPGLTEKAHGNVWAADVSGLTEMKTGEDKRILTLYKKGRRLPRARGPGFSPAKVIGRNERNRADPKELAFPKGTLRNLPDISEAEIVIVPCHFWVMNILPLESVNERDLCARTSLPGTYPLTKNGMGDRDNAWIENVIEVLDEPGEWTFNSTEGRIYLFSPEDEPGNDITAPLLTELIKIEGAIDYDGPSDKPVQGLAFRGLTFTQGERAAWHGRTGLGLQHDWEMFDAPTALVRLRGAEKCKIEDCTFTESGHTAIRLDLHCTHNSICRNRIERIGGAGILLAGYGPGTKDVNRQNIIRNNYIHHIGEIYWGSAGIFIWQSGENRIENNHIHHTPYTGIVVSGRIIWDPKGEGECSRTIRWKETGIDPQKNVPRLSWKDREKYLHGRRNLVQRNDIHNSMQVLGDGNCIYISGTGSDNLVRENYCHDCNGRYMNAMIRCDDDQHGTIIEKNVLHRTRGFGEGIISKGDNDIINNVIFDLRPDERHRGFIVFPYGDISGSSIRHNVLYSRRAGLVPYYEGKSRGTTDTAPDLRKTQTDFNLYFNSTDPNWMASHLDQMRPGGIDSHSLEADPLFRDPDNGDFSYSGNSPAGKLGIAGIDTDLAGLEPELREKTYGRRIATYIDPPSCMILKPLAVTLTSSEKDACIRYTLDGSEPTEESKLYTNPVTLYKGEYIRARSFADGCTDLTGASVRYTAPPPPIAEDFESTEIDSRTSGAETLEESKTMTARVSDEQASGGKKSLKFTDSPGQKHAFNPHMFYRTSFSDAVIQGTFDLLIDENTTFSYQWRDYSAKYKLGPAIQIKKGGRLMLGKLEFPKIPAGEWVHIEVICGIGEASTGNFNLAVHLPNEKEPRRFEGLAFEPGFKHLDWVGFIANGEESCEFYIDNIAVRPLNKE